MDTTETIFDPILHLNKKKLGPVAAALKTAERELNEWNGIKKVIVSEFYLIAFITN